MDSVITPAAIAATFELIRTHVRETPAVAVDGADFRLAPMRLVLKLELMQHSGSCDRVGSAEIISDCAAEPYDLTYRRARAILRAHDRHIGCRQWIAAAAYLSAGLDDE